MPQIDAQTLYTQIDRQISRFENSRTRDKRKTKIFEIAQAAGTAGTTMLLGLSKFILSAETLLQSLAIVASAITAILTAWDALFGHKKLWILSARAARSLYRLRDKIEHAQATASEDTKFLATLQKEFYEVLDAADREWDSLRNRT